MNIEKQSTHLAIGVVLMMWRLHMLKLYPSWGDWASYARMHRG